MKESIYQNSDGLATLAYDDTQGSMTFKGERYPVASWQEAQAKVEGLGYVYNPRATTPLRYSFQRPTQTWYKSRLNGFLHVMNYYTKDSAFIFRGEQYKATSLENAQAQIEKQGYEVFNPRIPY